VDLVELFRSIGLGGGSGGEIAFLCGERKGDAIVVVDGLELGESLDRRGEADGLVTYSVEYGCIVSVQ
jgi:hypothetical protein